MGKVFHHDTRGSFGKLRLPGRAIYKDLDRVTFIDVLETSPGEKHFNLHKEVNGGLLLSYEYELRAQRPYDCREGGFGVQAARWTALNGCSTGCSSSPSRTQDIVTEDGSEGEKVERAGT